MSATVKRALSQVKRLISKSNIGRGFFFNGWSVNPLKVVLSAVGREAETSLPC